MTIACRVTPGGPRDEVVGWKGGRLHLRVHAPAHEGRANGALVDLLADVLQVGRARIHLLHGHRSREKTVLIVGLGEEDLRRRLPALPGGDPSS